MNSIGGADVFLDSLDSQFKPKPTYLLKFTIQF